MKVRPSITSTVPTLGADAMGSASFIGSSGRSGLGEE